MQTYDTTKARDCLYKIITSRCPTSMSKYKLYKKALQIKSKVSSPLTRRARSSRSPATDHHTPHDQGDHTLRLYMHYYLIRLIYFDTYMIYIQTLCMKELLAKPFKIPPPKPQRIPLKPIGQNKSIKGILRSLLF